MQHQEHFSAGGGLIFGCLVASFSSLYLDDFFGRFRPYVQGFVELPELLVEAHDFLFERAIIGDLRQRPLARQEPPRSWNQPLPSFLAACAHQSLV